MVTRILAIVLPLAAIGCAHKPPPDDNERINRWLARRPDLPPADYSVESPDVLRIIAPKIKELDRTLHKVRPDGTITLAVIGEVPVAGLDTDRIAQRIRERAVNFYDPKLVDIRVQVTQFNSKFIYVFGQASKPGPKAFTGRETVLSAIADARLNNRAWPQKVVLVRRDENVAERQKVTVDVKRMWEYGVVDQNYLLQNGDVIYIPASPLAQIALKLNQALSAFSAPQALINLATSQY